MQITLKVHTIINTFIMLFCAYTISYAFAEEEVNKVKNQTLTVITDAQNCATAVNNTSPDNCKAIYGDDRGPCKNKSDCVCSKKEKDITWVADRGQKIEIDFLAGSPFKSSCELKSLDNGKVECKVKNKGDFEYEVKVEGCEDKPYDPRIIVQ
ncbi:hypothetical protein [Thalassotalea aquiviva]|uniref:hypothetical protein n=1 Tax=Thalassotalea aquiviva TaxID=3242415 RepID=UPI00352AB098